MSPALELPTPPPSGRHRPNESAFATVEFMVAVAFSFLLLVMVANLILVQYGRGVVRAAVDEGARAGARFEVDAVDTCEARVDAVIGTLGKMGNDVTVSCTLTDEQVRATATASFEGWLPVVPTFTEEASALARKEVAPQ